MTFPPTQTKLYRIRDNAIETFTFIRATGKMMYLEDERGVTITIPVAKYQNFCLSRRMVLTELEAIIRKELDKVHDQLRELAIEFNPLEPFDRVYVNHANNTLREVHKYDSKSGRFIESYPSISHAALKHGGKELKGNIVNTCKGRRNTSQGFKWSYQKMDRIQASF